MAHFLAASVCIERVSDPEEVMSTCRKQGRGNRKTCRSGVGSHALVSQKSFDRMRQPEVSKTDGSMPKPIEEACEPPAHGQEGSEDSNLSIEDGSGTLAWPSIRIAPAEVASESEFEATEPTVEFAEEPVDAAKEASDPFDDSEDVVRRMKSAYLAALAAAERDAQLQAKQMRQMDEKRRVEEMALEYEQLRLEDLRTMEEMEAERKDRERKGGEIIRKQIEEHEQQKAAEAERIEAERKEALRRVQLELEEAERAAERKEAKKKAEMEEMKRTNAVAIEAKQRALEEEMEMDRAARIYLEEAQRREEEMEEQMKAERLAREEEINKLRKAQMEVSQAVSNREELLVKKAIENAEKAWKQQQVEEAAKKKTMAEELRLARKQYMEHKARLESEAAQRRKDIQLEYQKEEEEMKQVMAADRQKFLAAKEEYRSALTEQLDAKCQMKKQEVLSCNQEAETFLRSCEKKKQSLDSIKEAMIEDLTSRGVPAEYTSLLSRVKI